MLRKLSLLFVIIIFSGCISSKLFNQAIADAVLFGDYDKLEISNQQVQTYTGWWIYGEGQHIFKNEENLGEWTLTFPNENMEELVELYLAVCEMEYFPMECNMIGKLQNDTLEVADFEITYIQGCEE